MKALARATASPAPGLRERQKRAKRERIQRAARELFERKGFAATTAREIARRAGVATGTLFLYARDKRDLLFLVFQDEARRLFAEAEATTSPDADLVDALMALFARFFDFYDRNAELAAALLQELLFRPHEPERLGALSLEYLASVARLVERARARGEVRRDVSMEAAVNACFAHYSYWIQSWLGARMLGRAQAEARLREALRLQLEGLRPADTRRRR